MIAIGVQTGGPEQKDSSIRKMLMRAMNAAARVREPNYNDGTTSWINPIFLVPGSVLKPNFVGYELGHFSKKEKGLVIQIAVPESVVTGECPADFIHMSLCEAVQLASSFFASKGISFSVLKAEKIVSAIQAELSATL